MTPTPTTERRASVAGATTAVRFYVLAAVATALMTVAAVVLLAVLVPDNTSVIATVIGITSPIILSLIAFGQRSIAVSIDGKMSQLLRATAEKERAQGLIQGLRENPETNISQTPKEKS